jgi:transposase InsO family protein
VKYQLVDAEKAQYPIQVLCAALDLSRSGFYAWRKRPASARAKSDDQLAVEIAATHAKSQKRYGSPRVHRALRKKGIRVGRKRVARLMRQKGIIARQKRRFRRTTDSNHASPIAPNLVARDFEPAAPNLVWAGDVTYVATGEGWTYLAVLLDLFSRRVVGWAMSATNDTELALTALHRAVRGRHFVPAGLVHHTDRGSPYASDDYRRALSSHAMVASMSRTGDCWDNAVAESFFATLRAELVDEERYPTRRAAEASIGDYIDSFYNVERLHSHLDYVSPIEFELKDHLAAIAA